LAKEAIRNGQCVVIGLQSTGEAACDKLLGSADSAWDQQTLFSVCKAILLHVIDTKYRTGCEFKSKRPSITKLV
jgi:hypothetical protein